MDFNQLKKPLEIKDIDFRIQSINKWWYATILAYKDARVDMNRLDKVVWPWLWKREHFDNNSKCKVSIWNDTIKEWVSKEDIGTKSMTEWEKGIASDSFKRACFNWGIGRELYDYPAISIKLNNTEFEIKNGKAKQTWGLQLKDWTWTSDINEDWVVMSLIARDDKGNERFNFGMWKTTPKPTKPKGWIDEDDYSQLDCEEWSQTFKDETDINNLKFLWERFNKWSWSADQTKWITDVKDETKNKLLNK